MSSARRNQPIADKRAAAFEDIFGPRTHAVTSERSASSHAPARQSSFSHVPAHPATSGSVYGPNVHRAYMHPSSSSFVSGSGIPDHYRAKMPPSISSANPPSEMARHINPANIASTSTMPSSMHRNMSTSMAPYAAVSYTHLRAHET